MEQIKTAREMLAQIEEDFFKGAGLAEASLLKGDERRAFKLPQVERLLTVKHGSSPLAMYLSDMFWTADEGRKLPEKLNPLITLTGQQTLTDNETSRLQLILEIAGLCHDLSLHFTFDLKEAFGIRKNDFWVSNKQLVEWLNTTEYEQIAMHTAYIMKKFAINVYANGHYQPAQDELAELYSAEYRELIRQPDNTDIPPRGYVKTILDAMLEIERHWQRGMRLKLKPDLILLHDEIYGVVPYKYNKGVLQAAQELYDYMDSRLCGRLLVKGYDENLPWDEQTESVQHAQSDVMNGFVAKVREVRSKYFAKGWIADDSLAFMYLMAHAERCGYGIWREEDDVL